MAEFLEERISERIRYGSTWQDDFSVEITVTAGGAESRRLVQPYPVRTFEVSYVEQIDAAWSEVMSLFRRAFGRFAGFRLKCFDEDSTNGRLDDPTPTDGPMALVADGVYQLQKTYDQGELAATLGHPVRTIFKPVAGTTRVAIAGDEIRADDWVVDTTTGRVTFDADVVGAVTAITQAAQAVITVGANTYVVGMSVHVSGVAGMTQINGLRGFVVARTATTITLDIDSASFDAYTSGGATHTRPQPGEVVSGGCRFDFPVRFDSTMPVGQNWPKHRAIEQLRLVELLNP